MTSRATWMTVLTGLVLVGCAGDSLEAPKVRPSRSDQAAQEKQAAPGKQDSKSFQVVMETTQGTVVIEVIPEWAPLGAARFRELVEDGFFDGCRFFRVVPNFVVQFGINGDPKVQGRWRRANLKDDRATGKSNLKGTVTFATAGANTRTTQLFVNLKDNGFLDQMGFTPFGKVVEGMKAIEKINAEYGGKANQGAIQSEGNKYLKAEFPRMDYIKTARVVKPKAKKKAKAKTTK